MIFRFEFFCTSLIFGFKCLAGHPALIAHHRPFPVTHWAAERWLHHMQQALVVTMDIDADSKVRMMNFFRYKIFWLKTLSHIYFTSCNIQFLFWVQISLHFMPIFMFFRYIAFFHVTGDELKSQNQQPQCKHGISNQTSCKNFKQIFSYSVVRSNKVTIIHQTSLM